MAKTLAELRTAVRDELGDVEGDVLDAKIDLWLNTGQAKLGIYKPTDPHAFTWLDGATSVALPVDLHHVQEIVLDEQSCIDGGYRVHGRVLYFLRPDRVIAGGATLYYWANFSIINDSTPSELNTLGDAAIVAYVGYRFFKMLAASRSEYRRYATITQANGVGLSDLDGLSEAWRADYEDARDALRDDLEDDPIATFFDG